MGGKPRVKAAPKVYEVVLRFTEKSHKEFFLGGLLDGFGENEAGYEQVKKGSWDIINVDPTCSDAWFDRGGFRRATSKMEDD